MAECLLWNSCNHCDCDKFCVRKYKVTKLYDNALMSDFQRKHMILQVDSDGTDLAEFKQLANIEKDIIEFVKSGKSLYIHSANCGNGKTSWALRLAQAYINKVWPKVNEAECHALFIDTATFLSEWKNNINSKSSYIQYIINNIENADLVIWDDIAVKDCSEYDIDKLFTSINARINAGKTNIYTSNRTNQEITEFLGERLASRICDGSIEVHLHGACKR